MYNLDYFEKLFEKYSEPDCNEGEFAIMAPLVWWKGKLCLLFEIRAMNMRRQPGEVCFPGGRIEDGEAPEECAVREAVEELGIDSERIRSFGSIGYLYSRLDEKINLIAGEIKDYESGGVNWNPDEVHKVFVVPFEYFSDKGCQDAFNYDGNYIWGLTARAVNRIIKMSEEGLK